MDALRDQDIDLSEHPQLTSEQFARAVAREGMTPVTRKRQVTLRVDADVLDWFKNLGKGYQSRINALLRAYMDAHKRKHQK